MDSLIITGLTSTIQKQSIYPHLIPLTGKTAEKKEKLKLDLSPHFHATHLGIIKQTIHYKLRPIQDYVMTIK